MQKPYEMKQRFMEMFHMAFINIGGVVMSVNSIKPEEALQELRYQEQILNALVESQVALRLMVKKGLVTPEEVANMRAIVRDSPKYKPAIEDVEKQKRAYQYAKDNPEEYLKAMFQSKLRR